jgi:outer membrane protein OmpA-like peptidoglycan-associated protein
MSLPLRLHAWFGTLELDDSRSDGTGKVLSVPALASALHGLVGDVPQLRRLVELFPRLDTRDGIERVVEAVIERVRDGGIAARLVETPRVEGVDNRPIVDLAALRSESARADAPRKPSETSAPTRFEVQIVDELGVPVADVPLVFHEGGGTRSLTTDGSGIARIDDGTGSFCAVSFGNVPALRAPLHERWRTIRPGDWLEPADERSVVQLRETIPGVSLRADTPHVISVQQRVVLARLLGMLFDTDKTFLLPSALGTIRSVKQLYDENPGASVLAVGHTDSTGEPDYNLALSSERADTLVAFLADDVDAWLSRYDSQKPAGLLWGTTEDLLMIGAMPDAATRDPSESPVQWYQRTRDLDIDGVAGPKTREKLVGEYMSTDGTSLPDGTSAQTHGCGESFPLLDAGDEQEVDENRRVELFLFESEIMPPPAGPRSTPDAPEYPEWQRRARETHDFRPGEHVLAPLVVAWSRAIVELLPKDTTLSLSGDGIPAQDLSLVDGETNGGVVSFAFDEASGSQPCTLTARGGGREIVLWQDQVLDRPEPPLRWLADLCDLADTPPRDAASTGDGDGDLTEDEMLVGDPPQLARAVA